MEEALALLHRAGSNGDFEMASSQAGFPHPSIRANGVTMGERTFRKRHASSFDLWASFFADDCAIYFNSRADLESGASYLYQHLRRFGLMMMTQRSLILRQKNCKCT